MKKLLLLAGLCFSSFSAFSQAMILDNTFSNDGLIPNLFPQANTYCSDVIVQPDGKIIGAISGHHAFRVFRLNPDGTYDNDFGLYNAGLVEFAAFGYHEETNAIKLQHDGKIVGVGSQATWSNTDRSIGVFRLRANGELDTAFVSNGTGIVTNNLNWSEDCNAYAVTLDADGTIIVVGDKKQNSVYRLAVLRYDTDGNQIGGNNTYQYQGMETHGTSVVLQPDGKALVSGHAKVNGNWLTLIMRILPNGALDPTFNNTGIAIADHGTGVETSVKVLLQSTGKVVLCSRNNDVSNSMIFDRFNTDGSVDNTFGIGGTATYSFNPSQNDSTTMNEAMLMPNDDIIAAGGVTPTGGTSNYGIVRLNGNNGSIQTTWGSNGMIITDINGKDNIYGMALTPDNKLLAAGIANIDQTNTTASSLAQYTFGTPNSVTGIQKEAVLAIYPNPSQGLVTIKGDKQSTLYIVNALGQNVRTVELSSKNNFTVRIDDLPKGVFFLQSTGGVVKGKIISL